MYQHKRRSRLGPPVKEQKSQTPQDEASQTLQGPPKPQVDPTPYANKLRKLYEPLLLNVLDEEEQKSLQRYKLLKRSEPADSTQELSSNDAFIAVRLTFLPDLSKGLRIIAYSEELEYHHYSKAHCDKTELDLPPEYNQKMVEKFAEISSSMGFKVVYCQQLTGSILIAQGRLEINGHTCIIRVELAVSMHGRTMFRQFVPPTARSQE